MQPPSPTKAAAANNPSLSVEDAQAVVQRDREIARRLPELLAAPKWPAMMMMCLLQQHAQRLPQDKASLASVFQKVNLDPPRFTNQRGVASFKATAELWNGCVVESFGVFRSAKVKARFAPFGP